MLARAARLVCRPLASHLDLTLIAIVVTTAALARLLLQLQAPAFGHNDTNGYLGPAYDLVAHQEVTNGLKRPIGYPLLLATVFATFGPSLMAVTALQHLLGIATVAVTYLLGRSCCHRWVGFGAGLLVAFSGPQLVYEQTLLPESLMILLVVTLALVLVRVARGEGHPFALLAGCLLGFAVLVKPVGQALIPFALLFAAVRPGTRSQRLWSVGALALALALTVTPWTFRNLVVHGQFSMGGALGDSLLARTARHSRGQFTFAEPDPFGSDATQLAAGRIIQAGIAQRLTETQIRRQLRGELGLSESQVEPLLQRLAIGAIRRQPLNFLQSIPASVERIYTRREPDSFTDLWESRQLLDTRATDSRLVNRLAPTRELERSRVEALLSLYQPASFGLVLPLLAVFGTLAVWWLRPTTSILVPAVLAFVLLMAHVTLNGPVTRYRYLIEPLLNVLALSGLWIMPRIVLGRLNVPASGRARTGLLSWRPLARLAGTRSDSV